MNKHHPTSPAPAPDADDMMLDRLIRTSVERLDRSEGLPSNFAYRMAMRASAEKARRAAASRRREQLLAWIVPVVMAIAAIVALWLTMPTLPSTLTRSVAEGAESSMSGSSIIMWSFIIGAIAILLAAESIFRRKMAHRASK
ncbi:MAG: hypothetical protein K1V71_06675 [Paramuribaculum sp.]|jgi:hypothetical protein